MELDYGAGYCGAGYCSEEGRFSSYLAGTRPPWPVVADEVLVRNLDFEFAEFARGGILLVAAAVEAYISMKFWES